ncbi:MAG TPA: FAD-dependent monooxygenase, partial [Actinomycetota bacterium]|nr:FAD-dependent monooxygenase [Actinomycetota bacterium]
MRTQVGIVGAGPAGLLLSHLLHLEGVDSVVLEARSRDHVEQRVRAGVLEQGTVELLEAAGVAGRLRRQGMVHHGIELRSGGRRHRVPLTDLTGRSITIYGQQEVVKDLIRARLEAGGQVLFEVGDVRLEGLDGDRHRDGPAGHGADRDGLRDRRPGPAPRLPGAPVRHHEGQGGRGLPLGPATADAG